MRRIGDRIIPKVARCPACIDNVRKDNPNHNRDPTQCKYDDSISVYWPCPACQRDLTRSKGVKNHLDTEP
eukprot:1193073-Pyramimonas_sp.AAC.1